MKTRIFIYTAILVFGLAIGFLAGQGLFLSSSDQRGSVVSSPGADTPYLSGDFRFGLSISPEKPVVGDNRFTLVLRSADGQPVTGATINGHIEMPAMGMMPAMRSPIESVEEPGGIYRGTFEIPMDGAWPLTLKVTKPGMTAVTFNFDMGTSRPGVRLASGAVLTGAARSNATTAQADGVAPIGTVNIDARRRQLIGVETAVVDRQPLYRTLRAYGQVRYDQTRISDVSLKYDTWIGEMNADFVGARVKKGDVLFTIFSPDLYAAQQEYLKIGKRAASSSQTLQKAASQRLAFWGMNADQIRLLESRGTPQEYVPILSTLDGYVVSKSIVAGSGAKAGTNLMRIADLSSLWIEAEIYEADLSLVELGAEATIELSYGQTGELMGHVNYIYPDLQRDTRTGRVRFSFPNADGALRPGMYAEVKFRLSLGNHIAVPEEALLVAGDKRVVFTDIGQGRLAPRYVKTGRQADGLVEILAGLQEGDRIVTSGNFLIASESKLKSGINQW